MAKNHHSRISADDPRLINDTKIAARAVQEPPRAVLSSNLPLPHPTHKTPAHLRGELRRITRVQTPQICGREKLINIEGINHFWPRAPGQERRARCERVSDEKFCAVWINEPFVCVGSVGGECVHVCDVCVVCARVPCGVYVYEVIWLLTHTQHTHRITQRIQARGHQFDVALVRARTDIVRN